MNILIVAPSWIGDCVIAQPLLARLRELHPQAAIDVLASPWVAPLFGRMNEVRQILDSPFAHGEFNWPARRRLARQLRDARYDIVYVLPNSWKSALIPWLARIPLRVGYHGEARYFLLNRRLRLDAALQPRLVDRYLRLAGLQTRAHKTPVPQLTSSVSQRKAARAALGLSSASYCVFCPGAEYGPAKRWPGAQFAALARSMGSPEHPVLLIGSAKDAALGEEIAQASGGCALNLCGRSTLLQAIDLIADATHVVSNDSGLMHIAAALGRPLVALFGSSSPDYTPPLSPHARIISLHLKCSPCFKRECPLGHLDCLKQITPERVRGVVERNGEGEGGREKGEG